MTSALAQRLKQKYYSDQIHPYEIFEKRITKILEGNSAESTLLDIGCGRTAPVLQKFRGLAKTLVGLEVVDFRLPNTDLKLLQGSICSIPLPDQSVDLIMARAVMEHVEDPAAGFKEVSRVLKPGGSFVFLTPNLWDYATLIAMMVPNRLHAKIVARTEGRAEEDVFPTVYKSNSKTAVATLTKAAQLDIKEFEYLSQYPNYFMFNGSLFFIATIYEKIISRIPVFGFLKGWILVTVTKPKTSPIQL